MPRLGSGEIQFHGYVFKPAVAIAVCFHKPPCDADRDRILAYLVRTGVDLTDDFSLTLDADGNEDVVLLFGTRETFAQFKTLVNSMVDMSE